MGRKRVNRKTLLAVLALLMALPISELAAAFFGFSLWRLHQWRASIRGYQTAFQGLQAEFSAVHWQDAWWSAAETPYGWKPSVKQFGYELAFDPDQPLDGWCDLYASQQPMVVADESYQPIVWQAGGRQYEIHRVKLKWAVNVWLSGTEAEAGDWGAFNIITWEPNYAGAQIWIKLTPRAFRYFQDNPEQLYIAPAYIGVEAVEWAGVDQDNRRISNDPDMSQMDIYPKARGEALGIYYARGGVKVNVEEQILRCRGAALDPQVFRGEYWTSLTLINFKPVNKFEWQIWHRWKYPSVKLELTVLAFVVGVWRMQLREGEVPSLEAHSPAGEWRDWAKPLRDFMAAVGAWWSDPWNKLTLWLLVAAAALILLALMAPGVLRGLGAAAEAGGRRLAEKLKRRR